MRLEVIVGRALKSISGTNKDPCMFVSLLTKIDAIAKDFVIHGYQQLVQTYSPAIYGLVTLCLIIYGYAVLQGWLTFSLAEVSKRVLTIGFVLVIALDWGIFSRYIYVLFTNSSFTNADSINEAFQQAVMNGIGYGVAIWERGSWQHWFPFFWGGGLILLVWLMIAIAIFELVIAKLGLAMFLVLAPLVIPMLLFKATQEFVVNGWLRHVIGFAFIPIFVTTALALCLLVLADSSSSFQLAIQKDRLEITDTAPYILATIACIGLLLKAAHMAVSFSHGFCTAMTPHIARAATAFRYEMKQFQPNFKKDK
jgi:type IV secretion system protein VirB6